MAGYAGFDGFAVVTGFMDTYTKDDGTMADEVWRAWVHKGRLRDQAKARRRKKRAAVAIALMLFLYVLYAVFAP